MPISIDIHENEFLEEIFQQGREQGLREGREEGRQEAVADFLRTLLINKFGAITPEVSALVDKTCITDLDDWPHRILNASTLDEILAPNPAAPATPQP